MEKAIFGLAIAFIMAIGVVSATPFDVVKYAEVTGDWVWDGGSWTKPEPKPITATYEFHAVSPLATSSLYTETEHLGSAWKYGLDMSLGANSAGYTQSIFAPITVNDPATTPATGGYTQYGFYSESHGEFTSTSLTVVGEGEAHIGVSTNFDGGFTQLNQVRVNE